MQFEIKKKRNKKSNKNEKLDKLIKLRKLNYLNDLIMKNVSGKIKNLFPKDDMFGAVQTQQNITVYNNRDLKAERMMAIEDGYKKKGYQEVTLDGIYKDDYIRPLYVNIDDEEGGNPILLNHYELLDSEIKKAGDEKGNLSKSQKAYNVRQKVYEQVIKPKIREMRTQHKGIKFYINPTIPMAKKVLAEVEKEEKRERKSSRKRDYSSDFIDETDSNMLIGKLKVDFNPGSLVSNIDNYTIDRNIIMVDKGNYYVLTSEKMKQLRDKLGNPTGRTFTSYVKEYLRDYTKSGSEFKIYLPTPKQFDIDHHFDFEEPHDDDKEE